MSDTMRETISPAVGSAAFTSAPARPDAGHFTAAELAAALRATGLDAGDTVFLQADLDRLGAPAGPASGAELLLRAVDEVLGDSGTLVVPAYTFSHCRGEPFDVRASVPVAGPWCPSAEVATLLRARAGSVRSADPIHSVVAHGPAAAALVAALPATCFGAGCIHERLLARDAKLCLVGLPYGEAALLHHAEVAADVPYRFRKLFTGETIEASGARRQRGWVYDVRILAANARPDGRRLWAMAAARGMARAAPLGDGCVIAAGYRETYDFAVAALREDPWLAVAGPPADPVALERKRVAGAAAPAAPLAPVALPPDASMTQMVDALWRLPRDIVSDGYDVALSALASQVPMAVHEFPTGTECWSWIVPERWSCHEAWLETLDGRRIFSYADHPLHVVSYSLPFEGEVSRDELLRHLHVHPVLPDAVPFMFKYYERDWGLCCSRRTREALDAERYRVVIRTSFSYDTLKVGEVVVPGRSEESIVLCAHLCHPHMVNDDLTGVVVGIDVMRALLRRPERHFTYRLLIVPETIGSVAYLSRHEALVPGMRGGLFLEMLGRALPHALQLSFAGDSAIDRLFALVLAEREPTAWTGAFRTIIGNDERQFNAPGVRVPMLSLSRVLPAGQPQAPYPEYHSSADTPERVPAGVLEESRDLVLHLLDALEADRRPRHVHKGEVFCSRYGIHVDWQHDAEGHRALFDVLFLADGTRRISEICRELELPFSVGRRLVERLVDEGVLTHA